MDGPPADTSQSGRRHAPIKSRQQSSAAAGDTDAEYRAGMVASQVLGLAVARFVLALGPVASASPDDLAATIGPTLQRYLTGEIRAAGPDLAAEPDSG